MLKSLKINQWNQFNSVQINFHPKITIITGSNGAGKSTLFRMLSSDMGWGYTEVSNPIRMYFAIQMCTIMQRKVQNFASWVLVFRQRMRDTITVTCEI